MITSSSFLTELHPPAIEAGEAGMVVGTAAYQVATTQCGLFAGKVSMGKVDATHTYLHVNYPNYMFTGTAMS